MKHLDTLSELPIIFCYLQITGTPFGTEPGEAGWSSGWYQAQTKVSSCGKGWLVVQQTNFPFFTNIPIDISSIPRYIHVTKFWSKEQRKE